MHTSKIISMVALLALAAPVVLHAQEDTPVATGDRVRVWRAFQARDPLTGSIESVTSDSLVLDLEGSGQSVALARADVGRLEVSRRTNKVGTGFTLGFVFGVVGAVGVCSATWEQGDEFLDFGGCNGGLTAATFLGSIALGGIIGAAVTTESWEGVPLSEIRVGPSQHAADGVSVSATIRG